MPTSDVSLESVEIVNLFGKRSFKLRLDPKRPTILTGGNGTGKSTILRLINALSNADMVTLATAPLDGLILNLRGTNPLRMIRRPGSQVFSLEWGQYQGEISSASTLNELPVWATSVLEDNAFDIEDAIDRISDVAASNGVPFSEFARVRETLRGLDAGEVIGVPSWLAEFGAAFPVLFVSDQRLVTERVGRRKRGAPVRQKTNSLAVESAASEISDEIDKAFSRYGRTSQQLDRSFPAQLIKAMADHSEVTPAHLNDLVVAVDNRRRALRQVGLLEEEAEYSPEIPESDYDEGSVRTVMNAVLNSTIQKFEVFDDLERRLSTLKEFLDARFSPKSLVLSRSEGMRFHNSGQEIRPRQLSSGEQQMMVLAYEILFRAKPGTLVIVDEPELSLHVLWQDSLIEDLTRMGDIAGLQFLMATHSPTILAEHPELERALTV